MKERESVRRSQSEVMNEKREHEVERRSVRSGQSVQTGMRYADKAPRKSRHIVPQLQAKRSRLSDKTRLRRLQNTLCSQGARMLDLCHAHVSHKAALPFRAARLYHLRAEATRQQNLDGLLLSASCVVPSWTPNLNVEKICSTAKATRGHNACVDAS